MAHKLNRIKDAIVRGKKQHCWSIFTCKRITHISFINFKILKYLLERSRFVYVSLKYLSLDIIKSWISALLEQGLFCFHLKELSFGIFWQIIPSFSCIVVCIELCFVKIDNCVIMTSFSQKFLRFHDDLPFINCLKFKTFFKQFSS